MDVLLLMEVRAVFGFPQLSPDVLFLFQNLTWDPTFHWVILHPGAVPGCVNFPDVPGFGRPPQF